MDRYGKKDESTWWVLHPFHEKTYTEDLGKVSTVEPSVCDEYIELFKRCAAKSLDPEAQCRSYQEDLKECRLGAKQRKFLSQYEFATNSFTVNEKNDFRNRWHETFFRGSLL
eukprot:EG_transcript_58467